MRKEDRAGLQLTIIIHLVVLIVLLVFSIGMQLKKENSFVLDFTRQEEVERQQEQQQLKEDIEDRIERKIAQSKASAPVRNVAVSGNLSDDRNSDAQAAQLYRDAERLENDLRGGYKPDIEEDAREEAVEIPGQGTPKEQKEYSGPSVLSWTLEGRKASHLPIPAYRCYGAGVVHVIIVVNQQGQVINAKVDDSQSESDQCLRNFAVRAARSSRFNHDGDAPLRQAGEIVYQFIAQ